MAKHLYVQIDIIIPNI